MSPTRASGTSEDCHKTDPPAAIKLGLAFIFGAGPPAGASHGHSSYRTALLKRLEATAAQGGARFSLVGLDGLSFSKFKKTHQWRLPKCDGCSCKLAHSQVSKPGVMNNEHTLIHCRN